MSSIFCLIPPHILHEIIKRTDGPHRNWAIHTLEHSARLRGHRDILTQYELPSKNKDKNRIVLSANHTESLKGQTIRKEGDPVSGDASVDQAYDHMGSIYDFYFNVFERNSIDDNGLTLRALVHYSQNFDNAFWNGEQLTFGDGDGIIFKKFTKPIDVAGHELTHGITQYTADLTYQDEAGAINESMSDIFGSLIKQFTLSQTAAEADWIIGEGLFEPSIQGVGVRSLKAPGTAYDDPKLGKDPCPANMSHYVKTTQDNGGIHINCTIPSHAFYLTATQLGGHAWEKAGKIWYITLTKRLGRKPTFAKLANTTIKVANKLFGPKSAEVEAVEHGWKQVGVT